MNQYLRISEEVSRHLGKDTPVYGRLSRLGATTGAIVFAVIAALLQSIAVPLTAQTRMDATAYKKLLDERKGMKASDLVSEFNAGGFYDRVGYGASQIAYLDSIAEKYKLTPYERQLLLKNGFVVTERLSFDNYHDAFLDGYRKDLPVFISADAVLHALHKTNSNIMKDIERSILFRKITEGVLASIKYLRGLPASSDPAVERARADADILLVVAGRLLEPGHAHVDVRFDVDFGLLRTRNQRMVDSVLQQIATEANGELNVFTSVPRHYDYSQMKPRGHYAGDEVLESYFRALMWLGRTEMYVTAPMGATPPVPLEDVRRQCMMTVELAKIVQESGAANHFDTFEKVLTRMVGEQDNLSIAKLNEIIEQHGLSTEDLADNAKLTEFQQAAVDAGAAQQILSQILISDGSGESMMPAASFLLLGQRFILDSYIMGNLVFPHVGLRMMPSPLDVAFVMGNDAAIQLLRTEIDKHEYAANLAALRLLTESLDASYWQNSVYTSWLGAIRAASPPSDRTSLPRFMQTTAWWQKGLNTQLGSWAELRHDFLLYAKQSYTGGVGCFYPSGYVEPLPALYESIAKAAGLLGEVIEEAVSEEESKKDYKVKSMVSTLTNIADVTTTLATISRKQLTGDELIEDEQAFIKNWLMDQDAGCTRVYTGHYPSMFYGGSSDVGSQGRDIIIADVHTQPTDESGAMVGRVLHVGTGYTNMMIVVAEDPTDKCLTTYIGPVGSYYEHTTESFSRLTDQEWEALTNDNRKKGTPFRRPSWTNVYLANVNGEASGTEVPTLDVIMVSVQQSEAGNTMVENMSIAPNPSPGDMLISFSVPHALPHPVSVQVVDAMGAVIATLSTHIQNEGMYYMRWNGRDARGNSVPAATYFIVAGSGQSLVVQRAVVLR